MKKLGLVIGGTLGVAAVAAGVFIWMHNANKQTPRTPQTSSAASTAAGSFKSVAACKLFTLADARAVLGANAQASTGNGIGDSASDSISVSTCSYSLAGASTQDFKTITLLARAAKAADGAASNKAVFGADKPGGKQDISGVGDAAFWDAQLSQLDILKGNNWYIIGNMTGTHADSGTLAISQAVYNQIKSKL